MPSEIQEGFLCPICIIDLKDPSKLKLHFEKIHKVHENTVKNKTGIRKCDIGAPRESTFEHKFGMTKEEGKDVFTDPFLTKQFLELAGLKEDVLQSACQKQEIEKFCRENNVISRMKHYLAFSENPDWQHSIPSSRWYYPINEHTNHDEDSKRYTRNYSKSSKSEDKFSDHFSSSINDLKCKHLSNTQSKPTPPPKPNSLAADRNRLKLRNQANRLPIKTGNKKKVSSKPGNSSTKTYGTSNRPPAPPIPDSLPRPIATPLKNKNLELKLHQQKQSLNGKEMKVNNRSEKKKPSSDQQNDIRNVLLDALERINEDTRKSEYILGATDSSSDDEWND